MRCGSATKEGNFEHYERRCRYLVSRRVDRITAEFKRHGDGGRYQLSMDSDSERLALRGRHHKWRGRDWPVDGHQRRNRYQLGIVQVYKSGMVTGNGTVNTTSGTTIEGTLKPSGGRLTVSGNLSFAGTAPVMQCNVVPSSADNVDISGTAPWVAACQ